MATQRSANWVEVFEAGTHRGRRYTPEDLDVIVQNFERHRDTLKPPLKIGHDDKQELVKLDGLPAAGWVDALQRAGNKLLARFRDVADTVREAVKQRRYKRISSEIYTDVGSVIAGGKGMALRAVALLGGDIPEVKTLADVVALEDAGANVEVIEYRPAKKENTMSDDATTMLNKQVERLSEENGALKTRISEMTAEIAQMRTAGTSAAERFAEVDSDLAKARAEVGAKTELLTKTTEEAAKHAKAAKDSDEKLAKFTEAQATKEREAYLDSAVSTGRISPAEKEGFVKLWESGEEVVRAMIDNRPEHFAVKLTEKGMKGAAEGGGDNTPPGAPSSITESQFVQFAEQMIAEKKAATMGEAFRGLRMKYRIVPDDGDRVRLGDLWAAR